MVNTIVRKGEIRHFTDLQIWCLSKELNEQFGISAQIKDAVVSISANIAEGFGRYHYLDKIKFYLNSRGSLLETESHLRIAQALGFISQQDISLLNEILIDCKNLNIKINNFINSTRRLTT